LNRRQKIINACVSSFEHLSLHTGTEGLSLLHAVYNEVRLILKKTTILSSWKHNPALYQKFAKLIPILIFSLKVDKIRTLQLTYSQKLDGV